jgi:hypothetical protein
MNTPVRRSRSTSDVQYIQSNTAESTSSSSSRLAETIERSTPELEDACPSPQFVEDALNLLPSWTGLQSAAVPHTDSSEAKASELTTVPNAALCGENVDFCRIIEEALADPRTPLGGKSAPFLGLSSSTSPAGLRSSPAALKLPPISAEGFRSSASSSAVLLGRPSPAGLRLPPIDSFRSTVAVNAEASVTEANKLSMVPAAAQSDENAAFCRIIAEALTSPRTPLCGFTE